VTSVKAFVVSYDGVVYEKDLGSEVVLALALFAQLNFCSGLTNLQVRYAGHSTKILKWDLPAGWAECLFQSVCRTNRYQSIASATIPDRGAGQ
jgi:hypothetical protein